MFLGHGNTGSKASKDGHGCLVKARGDLENNGHGVLKHNSFINHAKQCCNASGGSAAIFLVIYAVRAHISSGSFH